MTRLGLACAMNSCAVGRELAKNSNRFWSSDHVDRVAALLDPNCTLVDVLRGAHALARHGASVFMSVVVARPAAQDRLGTSNHGNISLSVVSHKEHVRLIRAHLTNPKFNTYPDVVVRLEHLGAGSPVAMLISVCPAAQWNQVVARILAAAAPKYYRPFLRQTDLRAVFKSLQSALPPDDEIRVSRVSGFRRLLDKSARKSYQSQIEWTDLPFAEAFGRAQEELTFFRRTEFKVSAGGKSGIIDTDIQGGVTNFAQFHAKTHIDWLYQNGVSIAVKAIQEQFALACDRGRTTNDRGKPRALAADFTEGIATDQLPMLAARLQRMPRASVSILHGNPYLHASIVDLVDGSAFDFVLVSERRALLLPQGRATEGAVTRLCQFIYERIADAEFRDANTDGIREATH